MSTMPLTDGGRGMQPATVLATKLYAPPGRTRLVSRPRLAELLDSTLEPGHRLTLVSGPAGFGKTTLLSHWLTRLEHSGADTRVGWLSLDAGDNDPIRLLTHLVAVLRGIGLDVDPAAVESLPDTSMAAVLTSIVNDVAGAGAAAQGRQWVVVLDDYHAIEASEVHEAVTFLLDHLPAQLHVVIATRSDPPLPMPRLRGRGQLTEVRAADLRFTPAEAQEFLRLVMGLDLTAGDVAALEERTEGWIAGLQLAALSLRGLSDQGAVAEFIAAFTGSDRFVIDYLVDEVLARQPARTRDFLLCTAVLDRLTGPLCDAVVGGTDGAQQLSDLERANLFLVPLDDQRTWYRYHHLFADVLRARLLAEHPDRVRELHRRASEWFATHDLSADAVRHALAGEDFDRAAYLMEAAVPELRRTRQDHTLLAWLGSLPADAVRRSPVLSLLSAWSQLVSGDLDAMEVQLDDAEAALAAGVLDRTLAAAWPDTDDLRRAPAMSALYRAALAQAKGDIAGTARQAQRALELAGPGDHFVRGAAAGFLGLAAWATGDIQQALSTFSESVRSLQAAGNVVDALDATVVLADMWVSAGRPSRARRLYDQALAAATGKGEPYPRATADLHVGLAELDRELDDLAGAEAHLETARVLRERVSITENRHRWFVAMAQVRAARGDHDSAVEQLERAAELYRPGFYPDIRPIPAGIARVRLAQGDLAAADQWARDQRVSCTEEVTFLREYDHLTLVRLLLARHRRVDGRAGGGAYASQLNDALALLDRLHAAADPTRAGSLIEIGMLRSLVHDALGHWAQAIAELEQTLARAPEADGYVRLFLDEGAPMIALRRAATPGSGTPSAREHRRDPEALADPLSDRELEVLGLLDSELTGPEIARRLFVSVNTLRTHTKRIFTKLEVNNRAAAVRRGRQLGLL